MSTSFASALSAAHEAASAQHYPASTLYVVATPIGNLADITLRALHVLQLADVIACEDTRHTQSLLRAYGIDKNLHQLLALHQHNEATAAQLVLEKLRAGQRIAYVSDAGTPGISDPGARLSAIVQAAGFRSMPLPGASCITAAMSVTGATAGPDNSGFIFHGFLPVKSSERAQAVQRLSLEARCIVLLEAPHRIQELAKALEVLGSRPVTLAREITKQFEEINTLPAQDLVAWLAADAQRCRGEFVVILHPVELAQDENTDDVRILSLLLQELPLKSAVKLAVSITGGSKNVLYEKALALKGEAAA